MNLLLFPSYFIPHTSSLTAAVVFYLLLTVCPVAAGTFSDVGLPSYTVKFLGNNSGYPTAINDNGQVTGWVTENGGLQAFISTGGMNARLLPLPVGAGISRANDINNHGVVVGYAGGGTFPRQAVAWYPQGQGYKIVELGTLPGRGESEAVAINNSGDIVGVSNLGPGLEMRAVLFKDSGGVTDLSGHGFTAKPTDINDGRQVIGGSLRLSLDTMRVEDLGKAADGLSGIVLSAINNFGEVAALSETLGGGKIVRYIGGPGWEPQDFSGVPAKVYMMNDKGDMTMEAMTACASTLANEKTPVVLLRDLGTFCLNDLIKQGGDDWVAIPGSGHYINNRQQIAVAARSPSVLREGTILLTPAGYFDQSAYYNTYGNTYGAFRLSAKAHEPTDHKPWIAIVLDWTAMGSQVLDYAVERRPYGQTYFVEIDRTGLRTDYVDKNVSSGKTYEYRVAGLGRVGFTVYSNIASARAPSSVPPGPSSPTVSILSPVDGARVSGTVDVRAQANAAAGLKSLDLRLSGNSLNLVICTKTFSGEKSADMTCPWNTTGIKPGTYQLMASVHDMQNLEGTAGISVRKELERKSIRVSDIDLSAKIRGDRVRVAGRVKVEDQTGDAVRGAMVQVTWVLPDGKSESQSDATNGNGEALFQNLDGHGTFTLTVNNVVLAGAVFDPANSKLSASITQDIVPSDPSLPAVSILSPANGARVSGTVDVRALAKAVAGLKSLELRLSGNSLNFVICTKTFSGEMAGDVTCPWDTERLKPGTYQLIASAHDMQNLVGTAGISVRKELERESIRVSDIDLSAKSRGDRVRVAGRVKVEDQAGDAVRGAMVQVTWVLPDGKSESQSDATNGNGEALFQNLDGPGTFTLTVNNVVLAGAVFDPANSKLSASITQEAVDQPAPGPAEGRDSPPPVKDRDHPNRPLVDEKRNDGPMDTEIRREKVPVSIRVRDIDLQASTQGSRVRVIGRVSVEDQAGNGVGGVMVQAAWSLPDGRTESQTDMTNASGEARFQSMDGSGTYTLRIISLSKPGAPVRSSGGRMSASITQKAEEEPVPPAAKTKKELTAPEATPDKPKRPPKTPH